MSTEVATFAAAEETSSQGKCLSRRRTRSTVNTASKNDLSLSHRNVGEEAENPDCEGQWYNNNQFFQKKNEIDSNMSKTPS